MDSLKSSNLGYPRIGVNREWKKLLEALWANKIQESEFEKKIEELRLNHLKLQQEKGIDLIPVNDFSLYDHMLDTAAMFGIVSKRFNYPGGVVSLSTYYAMARGSKGAPACEMTKWFNTNYHYIVPELNDITPVLTINKPLQAYREAKQKLGIDGKPVLIGLYTFLKLSKGYKSGQWDELIALFLPLYAQILRELEQEGVRWVQIDEPVLVSSLSDEDMDRITHIYKQLHEAAPGLNIMLQTYFDAVEHYEATVSLPVQGIGLDLVHGYDRNMQHMAKHGFPKDKVLGAGLIDGRNIWAADLQSKLTLLNTLSQYVPYERMIIQPSCSLLHVPVTTGQETKLGSEIRQVLAFANEKLDEIVLLTKAVQIKIPNRSHANLKKINKRFAKSMHPPPEKRNTFRKW